MKGKWIYIITLFFCGIFFFSTEGRGNVSSISKRLPVITKVSATNSEKPPFNGTSPFIRFHSGTTVNSVSIATPNQPIIPLKPVNILPEKFAGIIEYLSSLSDKLPDTRDIFSATPLRAPPVSY